MSALITTFTITAKDKHSYQMLCDFALREFMDETDDIEESCGDEEPNYEEIEWFQGFAETHGLLIEVDEANASHDEIVDFVKSFGEEMSRLSKENPEDKDKYLSISFEIDGNVRFTNCGEEYNFAIAYQSQKIIVQRSPNYIFGGCCDDECEDEDECDTIFDEDEIPALELEWEGSIHGRDK